MTAIALILLLFCLFAIGFYCYAIYAARDLFEEGTKSLNSEFLPPVSILKPICGLDWEAYENFASFCEQDYPEYQIVFAVRDRNDPVIEIVDKIIFTFPDIDIELLVSDHCLGTNFKVNNLANAVTATKHSILVISDSDIRVRKDYLRQIIQPMQDSQVGVVTCLYRSLTGNCWPTIVEALGIATEFHPKVLVARRLEGVKFALGSTIAIRKNVLEAIGGFPAIVDYLADDFLLGNKSAAAGYKVVLSDYVVEHIFSCGTFGNSMRRQIRWNRGTRISRPGGYLGLILTQGTVTSCLFLLATGGSILGWTVLGITWIVRLLMARTIAIYYLNDPAARKFLWLVPFCDFVTFLLWCCGFVGNSIEWRGRRLKLTRGGKLEPVSAD
jgi:ceramide glucosyltransferase